jgi:DNA repair exonuclease SbcCD ATPase subunit
VDQTASAQSPVGFEKMRAMLARASDLHAGEQRQMFDVLEEIRSRLAPLESFAGESRSSLAATQENVATIQHRLTELPDRTEVSVIAERLDESLARIDAQDTVLTRVIEAVTALSERVGAPLEALEGRLEGVSGRFEGVSGRLDGLDDRLQHLHSRLDETDATVARTQAAVEHLPAQLDPAAVHRRFDELSASLHQRLDAEMAGVHGRFGEVLARPAVDPSERLDALAARIEQIAERLEAAHVRVKAVEDTIHAGVGSLSGAIENGVDKIDRSVDSRPDRNELARVLRDSQHDSERRITQQLDGALADFAEVMLGGQSVNLKGAGVRPGGRKAGKKSDEDED